MGQTEYTNLNSETMEDAEKIDVLAFCVDFFRSLRRMWFRIILLGVLGGVLWGYNAESTYKAYYTASVTYTVNIVEEQNGISGTTIKFYDNEAAEQMAVTFPYILTSGVLQRKVAEELGVSRISGSISAEVEENTNLLTISVRDTDPQRAYDTLQAVLNNYQEVSEVIVGKVSTNLLDETGVPTTPDNAKDFKDDAFDGVVVGAFLGFAWVIAATFLRRTIRRESDCVRMLNQRCFGSIPFVPVKERSRKAGHRLNITMDSVNSDFKEAIRIIRNKVERSARDNGLKVLLITSALAGEGKSTLAVNLALSLAMEGKKVTLVDCDLRNPSDGEILGLETEKGVVDYLNGEAELKECCYAIDMAEIMEEVCLTFIPGGTRTVDGSDYLGNKKMKELVNALEKDMDYVILDSAPVGLLTDAGLLAQYAEGVMIVVKKDFARLDHIMSGMEHLAESGINLIGCVLNGE